MVAVTLDRADIYLYADPSRRVVINRLREATPTIHVEETAVHLEGYTAPVTFRGERFSRDWDLVAMFASTEHQDAADLEELFADAYQAADGRLVLRTHLGLVAGLDPINVVRVFPWAPGVQQGQIRTVRFTAVGVHHTLGEY